MNTLLKSIALVGVVTLGQPLIGSSAYAAPLDVDCDLLRDTDAAVNDFLAGQGIQFSNLGDLFAAAIQDEELFDQLSALLLLFSGGKSILNLPVRRLPPMASAA